jgi:hypothetical protein
MYMYVFISKMFTDFIKHYVVRLKKMSAITSFIIR